MSILPVISLEPIDRECLNACLTAWGHKMGEWNRPLMKEWLHGLFHNGRPVAVTASASLIRERCGGFTRAEAFELGRVCAIRRDINRAALRLWREFVFPDICRSEGYVAVISYQDAVLHSGNLYRFDGWRVVGKSRSGSDSRSGRKGRRKVVWAFDFKGSLQ